MSIKGLDSLLRKLSVLDDVVLDGAQNGFTKSLLKVQRDAKRHAPRSSSDLANSIHTRVDKGEKSISGSVYTNNPHAMYVEFGTGPKGKGTAAIIPKGVVLQYRDTPWFVNAKDFPDYIKYKFVTYEVDGETYILVRGQKAQQFMSPAAKMNKSKFSGEVSKGIRKSLRGMSR